MLGFCAVQLGGAAQAAARRALLAGACGALCAPGLPRLLPRLLFTAASPAALPGEHPLHALQAAITPQVCEALWRQGFAVVDGVFGKENAQAFREELRSLRGHMHMNSTHLVTSSGTEYLEKSHIHEAELMSQDTQRLAPLCSAVQRENTLGVMLSLFMPELRLDRHAVKLQYNDGGGGCFPIHFDSDAAVDSRRVTSIIYLNPGWAPGEGGELRLYPFPGRPVDVEPLHDRMVLFSSTRMAHRVLPSAAERYCFTIWLSDTRLRPQGASKEQLRSLLANVEGLGEEDAWRMLLHPAVYPHAVKWAHREEWAGSIEESHPATPARDELLGKFWREVCVIERALGPLLAVAQRAGGAAGAAAGSGGAPTLPPGAAQAWF